MSFVPYKCQRQVDPLQRHPVDVLNPRLHFLVGRLGLPRDEIKRVALSRGYGHDVINTV